MLIYLFPSLILGSLSLSKISSSEDEEEQEEQLMKFKKKKGEPKLNLLHIFLFSLKLNQKHFKIAVVTLHCK